MRRISINTSCQLARFLVVRCFVSTTGRLLDNFSTESETSLTTTHKGTNEVTVRIQKTPLLLAEEIPPPKAEPTDIELVMMAWCEEHARQYFIMLMIARITILLLMTLIAYAFYHSVTGLESVIRGTKNMPRNLRIGTVVYFDISEEGSFLGRVIIGLFNERCPLYCEHFHRRCTGSGGVGASFKGMKLAAVIPHHVAIFGDGQEMKHSVSGFHPRYLPTESITGTWRGCLSSIAYSMHKESPNFAIHFSSGDYKPQVFGMVVAGYNTVEHISRTGSKHGCTPKRHFVIENCGELCVLDKSAIVPMPWKLYESVSEGYDAEKFGVLLDEEPSSEKGVRSDVGRDGRNNMRQGRWLRWLFGRSTEIFPFLSSSAEVCTAPTS